VAFAVAALFHASLVSLFSQDAVRASLAGEQAAEARRRAAATVGYYNLKLGPAALQLSSAIELEVNDNVEIEQSQGGGADFVLRPQLGIHSVWPITERNRLHFSFSGGYAKYFSHSDLNRFFIQSGSDSGLSLDVYAGDFLINLHDRFSLTEQPYENASVSGNGDYGYFENTVGVNTIWDLNKLVINFGYDHVNRISTSSSFDQQDGSSEIFFARAGVEVRPGSRVGLEAGGGFTDYRKQSLNDTAQYNVGLFYQAQISQYIGVEAFGGYTEYLPDLGVVEDPETGALVQDEDSISSFYGGLSLNHRLNKFITYSVTGGHQIQLGLFSNTLDLYYARAQANWAVLKKVTITTALFYEDGEESRQDGEKFERFGADILVGRELTQKLTGAIQYGFLLKESNLADHDYIQNRVMFRLTYRF
jgi:hypothetical protein